MYVNIKQIDVYLYVKLMPTLQAAEESISKKVAKVSKVVNEAKEKHGSSACLVSLQRKRKNIKTRTEK